MKAIYTINNDKVYRINQNTAIPTSLTFKAPGSSVTMKEDVYNKEATIFVSVNTLVKPNTKSNKELYNELVKFIKDRMITEVPFIQNNFKIVIDYAVFVDGKEVEHQQVMKPVEPLDKIYPLGVATDDELVYRRVKTFNPKFHFQTTRNLPYGITCDKKKRYAFQINDISVYQDYSDRPEVHHGTYDVSYPVGADTLKAALCQMVPIFSTYKAGIVFTVSEMNYIPVNFVVDLDLILANLIVAYDSRNIDNLLKDNMDAKYHNTDADPIVPGHDPSHDHHDMFQNPDPKPSGDGHYQPDRRGYSDWYERATETNPGSLLVVEDNIPDGDYDINTMIKKKKVIKDIPDIEVGEYVLYRESLVNNW